MRKILAQLVRGAGVATILHLSVVELVVAQTSQDLKAAAGKANSSEFKLDTSDLYGSDTNSEIEIIGASPTGNVSVSPSDLYFGIRGQSAAEGALPSISTYEDLYGYRDQQLGDLEMGTGDFDSTGALNAEATAFEILDGSANTPSVASDFFLQTTRDLLEDIDGATAEFGECLVQQVTSTNTSTYDNSYTEICDTLALDGTVMEAQRVYNGPPQLFSYVVIGGQGYCRWNGATIKTDSATTCYKLSILTGIPTTNNGNLSVQSCSGNSGCVEIVLAQAGHTSSVNVKFTIDNSIDVTNAYVKGNSSNPGTVTYQGNARSIGSGYTSVSGIATTEGTQQVLSVYKNGETRQPPSGYNYTPLTDLWSGTLWAGGGLYWNGPKYTTGVNATSYAAADGWTYHRNCTDATREYCLGVWRTNGSSSGYGQITIRLVFDGDPFSDWVYNAAEWSQLQSMAEDQACDFTYATWETASKSNGCVNSLVGELCGTSIPVSPFTGLADRASTHIEVGLDCSFDEMIDEDGNVGFTELGGTCQELIDDPGCFYVSRTCGDELSDGTCLYYENTYSCGSSLTYSSPTVTEVNICNSNMSCMGDDCIINTGTDGSVDLADAASKLAAVDLILSDMDCSVDPNSASPDEELKACELFKGESEECKKVTLGLANCCKTASGVSLADYLQLAFAMSRVSRVVEGSALANPITSSWVDLTDLARDSFSKLTQPLTQAWESIVGNSGAASQGAGSLSVEAIKQSLMKNAAEWTAETFGTQAANSLFQVTTETGVTAAFDTFGSLNTGSIGLAGPAAAIMSTVMTAYAIYVLINVLADILFACTEEEQELMVKKALKSTHEIGTYCSSKFLGKCVTKKTSYCMFNSPLARILNEQARLQLNIGWGEPEYPQCQGITLEQFQNLDMDKVDLSEWTGMLVASGMIDMEAVTDIEALTGSTSTLGSALEDLYEREDAIERNINRLDGTDIDAARQDAVEGFGYGVTK